MNVIQLKPKLRVPVHSLYLDIQGRFNRAQNSFSAAEGLAEGFGIALGPRNNITLESRDNFEVEATALLGEAQAAEKLCQDMEETLTYRQAEFFSAGSTYINRQVQIIDGQRLAVEAQAILTVILGDVAELKSGRLTSAAARLSLEERSSHLQDRVTTLLLKSAA